MRHDRESTKTVDLFGPLLELQQEMQLRTLELTQQMMRAQTEQMVQMTERWMELLRANGAGPVGAAGHGEPSSPYGLMVEMMRTSYDRWSQHLSEALTGLHAAESKAVDAVAPASHAPAAPHAPTASHAAPAPLITPAPLPSPSRRVPAA